MAQIKFYSSSAMPSENIDANGLYFIDNGEIYKGAVRFGCGRVTTLETAPSDAARGDINITGGVASVFDGTTWQELGGTTPTFATGDADGQLKLGTVNATVSGWGTLASSVSANASAIASVSSAVGSLASTVDDLESTVSDIETAVSGFASIVDVTNNAVSAASGTFTDLTVTSTATFSVTSVSASALTVNGKTVEEITASTVAAISASTVTSSANGISVGVTTQGGSVTAVSVNATAFGNVMHFAGVVSTPSEIVAPAGGDIVVIGTNAASGYTAGQEYIYVSTTSTWEVIGDQNTYALNAYAPASETVTAGTTTLPDAVHAIASAFDTLKTSVSNIATSLGTLESTVSGLESTVGGLASTVSSISSAFASLGDAAQKSVATSVTASGVANDLPTCSAVEAYVTDALTWITA